MKLLGRSINAAVCGLVLFTMGLSSTAFADQGSAKVQSIRSGSAQYSTDGNSWTPLAVGTVLSEGATVKTDTLGVVDLFLGKNGPLVRLTPATTLTLTKLGLTEGAGETVVDTQLGLTTGRIQGVVRKLSQTSNYAVKTPVGTCGIRGTKYEISSTGRVSVLEGIVDVWFTPAGANAPVRFEVRAGYTFDPSQNNGQGGVTPTPTNIRDQLQEDMQSFRTVVTPEGRATVWIPSPSWMEPARPVDPSGAGAGQPWVLPPVYNPTTKVQ
jgi:hypothetical protein